MGIEIVRKAVTNPSASVDVEVYAEGVRLMKQRSERDQMDQLGWYYQSRMHGNPEALPRNPDEPEDWSQCQHGSWWFLPWHRMYLLQFERIVRSFTGVNDWALPYWDYPNAGDVEIPPKFLDSASSLFDDTRLAIPVVVAQPTWQNSGTFTSFAGPPRREPAHRGETAGALESNPHNPIHGFVGGNMAGFQSPLDPLFWIHHCNIDRLWEAWLTLPNRTNPRDGVWLDQSFDFPDPEEGRRPIVTRDVGSSSAAGYKYDDLTVPSIELRPMLTTMPLDRQRKDDELELLGATPIPGSVREPVQIGIAPGAAERRRALLADIGTERGEPPLFLRLENVGMDTGDASSMWNVYVSESESDEQYLAGTIAPFGLAGLTESGGRQTITFDISALSGELLASDSIEVRFEPAHDRVEGTPFWERAGLYTTAE